MTDRKSGGRSADGKFGPGNAGKPKGARHKVTRAVEELLEGEAETITRKAIEVAKAGDLAAIRLCIERILAPKRGATVSFDLPPIRKPEDVLAGVGAIIAAVSTGDLTPDEAEKIASTLEMGRRTIELVDLERRIADLEAAATK